jgi:hypothetical protein
MAGARTGRIIRPPLSGRVRGEAAARYAEGIPDADSMRRGAQNRRRIVAAFAKTSQHDDRLGRHAILAAMQDAQP